MAISKSLIATVFILLVLHNPIEANIDHDDQEMMISTSTNDVAGSSFVPKMNCGVACAARCQVASRQNMCKRACGTCCARCNCVPPGTSGNHQVCPCYNTITTRGGKRKCP